MCSVLTDRQQRALGGISRRKTIAPGQHVFAEGDEVVRYAVIVSGVVKLTRTDADGLHSIIGLSFACDFLGRMFKQQHSYSAEAATGVELCLFPPDTFLRLLGRLPRLERQLFESALAEVDACRDWITLLNRRSAFQRVAGFLHLMAMRAPHVQHGNDGNSARIALPLSRQEIADFLGVTMETVSRQMTLMKKASFIDLPSSREVVVPDIARLAALASSGTGADEFSPA
jgi:CRP/FNR family transcriptional regulator, anaerobic regulatory protein